MKKLYFVRHGLSKMNKLGHWSGTTETPLAPEGRQQARAAGQKAKVLNIDYIVCSPLSRAKQTASIIARQIGYPAATIHINNLLTERHFGELEGQPWQPDLNLDGITDIETIDTLMERAKLAVAWLRTLEADNILVVSHGSFGRALRSQLLADHPFSSGDLLANAEIVQWQ